MTFKDELLHELRTNEELLRQHPDFVIYLWQNDVSVVVISMNPMPWYELCTVKQIPFKVDTRIFQLDDNWVIKFWPNVYINLHLAPYDPSRKDYYCD